MKWFMGGILAVLVAGCTTTGVSVHPAHDPNHYGGKPHFEVIKMQDVEVLGITTRHDIIRYCPGEGKPCAPVSIQSYARPGVLEIFGPPVIHGLAESFKYRFITWGGDSRIVNEVSQYQGQSQEQHQEQEQKYIKSVPKKWRSPGWSK